MFYKFCHCGKCPRSLLPISTPRAGTCHSVPTGPCTGPQTAGSQNPLVQSWKDIQRPPTLPSQPDLNATVRGLPWAFTSLPHLLPRQHTGQQVGLLPRQPSPLPLQGALSPWRPWTKGPTLKGSEDCDCKGQKTLPLPSSCSRAQSHICYSPNTYCG